MSMPMFRFAPTLPFRPTVTLVLQSRELEKFSALKPNIIAISYLFDLNIYFKLFYILSYM